MSKEKATEKFRTLGVFQDTPEHPNAVEQSVEIFERCENLNDIGTEIVRRLPRSGCGSEQFLYGCLGALLEKYPEFKSEFLSEADQNLGELGIRPEHIKDYFRCTGSASIVFSLNYGDEYSKDVRSNFYKKANQFALNKMKKWLDI